MNKDAQGKSTISKLMSGRLMPDNIDLEFLFWLLERVNLDNGCWIRGDDPSVYTTIKYKGKLRPAHRVSYEIFNGKPLEHLGCHTCDRPACINPDHIFDGTTKENRLDAIKKGRFKTIKNESKQVRREKRADWVNTRHKEIKPSVDDFIKNWQSK